MLDQVAQYKADIKEARMKSGRRNVMFIHQTLRNASTPSDNGGPTVVAKEKCGRPKKVKLTDHPQQTIVTTPAASSVIKDTASCVSNGNSMEEACTSSAPLQINLSSSFINNNEQNITDMSDGDRTLKDTDSKTVIDHTPMDKGQPLVPPIAPVITKKQRVRRSSTGKTSLDNKLKL